MHFIRCTYICSVTLTFDTTQVRLTPGAVAASTFTLQSNKGVISVSLWYRGVKMVTGKCCQPSHSVLLASSNGFTRSLVLVLWRQRADGLGNERRM